MAVGMLTDAKRPELLISTLGAGIVCFDGHLFRQILGTNENARVITSLLPLASGRLLIGTAKLGLLIYDGKTLRRFHPTTNNVYVTSLAGSEAELWVGTLNDGVLWWHGGQTDRIGEEQGLPDRRVEQIALTGGRAYIGTPMGVAEVREGKVARVLAKGRYAHALLADGDALLVGQIEAGVMRVSLNGPENDVQARRPIAARGSGGVLDSHPFRKERGMDGAPKFVDSQVPKAGSPPHGRKPVRGDPEPGAPGDSSAHSTTNSGATGVTVEQFLAVGDARYALATDGLMRRDPDGAWRRILGGGRGQLTDRDVSALLVASDGRLWVGYFDRGLDILSATGGKVEHVENEHVFCVNRIVEDTRQGAVAVAQPTGW